MNKELNNCEEQVRVDRALLEVFGRVKQAEQEKQAALKEEIMYNKVVLGIINEIRTESISSKYDLSKALQRAMKKSNINRMSIEITSTDGIECESTVEVASASISRAILDSNLEKPMKIRHKFALMDVKRYSFDTMAIKVKDSTRSFFKILGRDIYVLQSPSGWLEAFYVNKGDSTVTSLDSGRTYQNIKQAKIESKRSNTRILHYKPFAWIASNKRNDSMQYALVNSKDGDLRFKILNNATASGFKMFVDEYKQKMIDCNFDENELANLTMDIQKNFGYIGNCLTGSVSWGKVQDFMVYNGKFTNYTNEMYLDSKVLDFEKDEISLEELKAHLKNTCGEEFNPSENPEDIIKELYNFLGDKVNYACETADGNAFGNARAIAKSFVEETGIFIDEKYFAGLAVQARPANCKVELTIVDFESFKAICNGAKTLADNEGKTISFRNADQEWDTVDWEKVSFLVDRNAMKLVHDYKTDIDLHVLAIPKESQGKTSKQLISTMLGVDKTLDGKDEEHAIDLIGDLAAKQLAEVFHSRITQEKYKMHSPSEMIEAIENGYISDVINDIAPNAKFQDKTLLDFIVKQTVNTFSNDVDGLNFDLTAHNRRLVPDMANIITGGKVRGILDMGEVFINRKNVKTVCMIKYPKMGIYEYYTAKNVSIKGIKAKCKRLLNEDKITKEESDSIVRIYQNMDSALAVLPAYITIAHCCAGLDFDWDGACFIEETKETFTKDEDGNKISELTEMDIITNKLMKKVLKVNPISVNF